MGCEKARLGQDPPLDLVGQGGPVGRSEISAHHDAYQASSFLSLMGILIFCPPTQDVRGRSGGVVPMGKNSSAPSQQVQAVPMADVEKLVGGSHEMSYARYEALS